MLRNNLFFQSFFLSFFLTNFILRNQIFAAKSHSVQIGISLLSHGLTKTTQSPSAKADLIGPTYYNFNIQTHFQITQNWLLSPELIYMPNFLLPRQSPDSTVKTSFMILGLPLTHSLNSTLDLDIGPAIVSYEIKGSGGTTTLNNGNGTSTFAIPARSETTRTIGILAGVNFIKIPYYFGLQAMAEGILDSQKKNYSLILKFTTDAFNF